MKSVSGHPSLAAISSYIVALSMVSRMMSAVPGVACQLLDEMHGHPAHRPVVDVLRKPRHVVRYGNRCVEVGFGEDAQRLGILLGQLVEQVGKSFVFAHHVLVGILRHDLFHRALVARRHIGRRGRPVYPALLDIGGVLDQSADRQRADRRRRSRLLIGQAVGHREERVLVEPQELDQCLSLVGCGWGHSWHRYFPFVAVWT